MNTKSMDRPAATELNITLDELRVHLKGLGIKVSWQAVYRWCSRIQQKGFNGEMTDVGGVLNRQTRQRVYLKAERNGRTLYTTLANYQEFKAKCNEGRE
jgi:hypothetical protein